MEDENLHSLEGTEGMMVRWMCGVSLKDRKQSEDLYSVLGVPECGWCGEHGRLRWFGLQNLSAGCKHDTTTKFRILYRGSPFQSLTHPSSPDDARMVPVMFQLRRHTWRKKYGLFKWSGRQRRLFTKNRKIKKLRCPHVCVEIFLTCYLQSFRKHRECASICARSWRKFCGR